MVIGGLVVSQFVTLFVTPAIYLYLEDFQENVLDRFSFFRSTRKQEPLVSSENPVYAMQQENGD